MATPNISTRKQRERLNVLAAVDQDGPVALKTTRNDGNSEIFAVFVTDLIVQLQEDTCRKKSQTTVLFV